MNPVRSFFAEDGEGQTPLDPSESAGLRALFVRTRAELDEVEARNILKALPWARRTITRLSIEQILGEKFIKDLHRRMFGEVWRWAGAYRTVDRNLGVPSSQVPRDVEHLLSDARYWAEYATYGPDELAIRLKHRLVAIHPFANGNGRHSRALADLVVAKLGHPMFSWGSNSQVPAGSLTARESRQAYIQALQAADNHDIGPILAYARS